MNVLEPTELERERFWSKVDQTGGAEACWLWQAACDTNGYGAAYVLRRQYGAHRVAFLLTHGRWPNTCACHHCDTPRCCNPSHLFEGTRCDNNQDAYRKKYGMTKEAMEAIRNSKRAAKKAARRAVHTLTRGDSKILSVRMRITDLELLRKTADTLARPMPDLVRRLLIEAGRMTPTKLENLLRPKPFSA